MPTNRDSASFKVVLAVVACFLSCKGEEASQQVPAPTGAALPGVEAAVQANLALLRSEDPAVRLEGAARLARMGPLAQSAVPALIDALGDPFVRRIVILAFHEMGPEARSAVPSLRKLLDDGNDTVRVIASSALRAIEHDERVQDAIAGLRHRDETTRFRAAVELRQAAPDAREAIPALIAVLNDRNPLIRLATIQTLGKIASLGLKEDLEPQSLIEELGRLNNDPDEDVRAEVARVQELHRLHTLAVSRFASGDYDESIELLSQTLRYAPDHVASLAFLGVAYTIKGSYDTAVGLFDETLGLVPRDAELFWGRGKALAKMGSTEEALADYNRALFLKPSLRRVYQDRALVHKDRKEYDLSVEDLARFLELTQDPGERHRAYVDRAWIYLVTENYDRSLEDTDRALQSDPSSAAAHYYQALAFEELGRQYEAEDAYRRFAEADVPTTDVDLRRVWLGVRERLGYPPESTAGKSSPSGGG